MKTYENTAFTDGHIEEIIDFPHDAVADAIDRGNPLAAEFERELEPQTIAADTLEEILRWCWKTPDFHAAFVKFVTVSALVRPALLDDQSYIVLAEKLGATKQNLSKTAVAFSKQFKIKFRRSHNGRENMRAARIQNHRKQASK